MRNVQIIYFDEVDEEMDSLGWNMVGAQGGAFVYRFESLTDAVRAAESADLPWVAVCRDMTTREAERALEDMNRV